MSEYKRFVTYLYDYNNGVKNRNVGFAKTQYNQGVVKIALNMKGAYSESEKHTLCMFTRKNGYIAGVELGNLDIRNGNCDFKGDWKEEELGTLFTQMCGLYIRSEKKDEIFAGEWDDKGVNTAKIVSLEDLLKKEREEAKKVESPILHGQSETSGISKELLKELSEEAREINILETKEKSSISNNDVENYFEDNNYKEQEKTKELNEMVYQNLNEIMHESLHENQDKEPYENSIPVWERSIKQEVYLRPDSEDIKPLHIVEEITDTYEQNVQNSWDILFNTKDKLELFSDDEIFDCVEIDPTDISKLPKEAWRLINNSFLNHGYFNFRHIILARKENPEGENGLVLGVPGVYNRRERMTACMFGFDKFKFSMRSDVHMNHFGYWYKEF